MNQSLLRPCALPHGRRLVCGLMAAAFLACSLPAAAANGRNPVRLKPVSTATVAQVTVAPKASKRAPSPAVAAPAPAAER